VKPSENKSTRLCRHKLLRVSAFKNLGGHDDSLDADENLESNVSFYLSQRFRRTNRARSEHTLREHAWSWVCLNAICLTPSL
jgi:hypothetical protein